MLINDRILSWWSRRRFTSKTSHSVPSLEVFSLRITKKKTDKTSTKASWCLLGYCYFFGKQKRLLLWSNGPSTISSVSTNHTCHMIGGAVGVITAFILARLKSLRHGLFATPCMPLRTTPHLLTVLWWFSAPPKFSPAFLKPFQTCFDAMIQEDWKKARLALMWIGNQIFQIPATFTLPQSPAAVISLRISLHQQLTLSLWQCVFYIYRETAELQQFLWCLFTILI